MKLPIRSIIFLMLGLFIGFGAAVLILQPRPRHLPATGLPASWPPASVIVEKLTCELDLTYSSRVTGRVIVQCCGSARHDQAASLG
jgi:hypothetical protein